MTPRMIEALERRKPRLAERTARFENAIAADLANDGKVPLPDLAKITAAKEVAIAAQAKLTSAVSKEKDAAKKAELAKIAETKERDRAYQESLERIAKGTPTKSDEEIVKVRQVANDAEQASMRAWLARQYQESTKE